MRRQIERTPNGETVIPRFKSSFEMRTWPQAGCSMAMATTASSISGASHTVLQDGLAPRDLLQGKFAAFVVKLLEPVEAVAAVAHHLAGLADIAELFCQFEHANLGADDFLILGHSGVLWKS
jgi:hypothetical protein